jgi:membrane protease YdiL (CAAX protease family)
LWLAVALLPCITPGLADSSPPDGGIPPLDLRSHSSGDTDSAAAARIANRAQDAIARGDLSELGELSEEAASLPPGNGPRLIEALGAAADLGSGRLATAITRLRAVGPLALIAFALLSLAGALILSSFLYLPCAALVSLVERRKATEELPAAPRSPLGLRSGLVLSIADDAVGFLFAFTIAWVVFHAPEVVLTLDLSSRAGTVAALAGTAAGNLGALALAFILYRRRGAGAWAAGFKPIPAERVLFLGLATAGPLLLLSLAHEIAFVTLMGREPRSNVEPLLNELFAHGAAPGVVLGLILTVVVIAPVAEETIYRGVIYRAFRDRAGVPLAVFLSGLLFSLTHLEPDHVLALWMIGATLAWLTERTGSIIPAIAAHGLFNGFSLGVYLLTRTTQA